MGRLLWEPTEEYIEQARKYGKSDQVIRNELLRAGWRADQIQTEISDNDAFNRTFAQLGLDGWEMVNAESGVFWFKRPI